MWLCEDKLKGKTAHFRLPSASQKLKLELKLKLKNVSAVLSRMSLFSVIARRTTATMSSSRRPHDFSITLNHEVENSSFVYCLAHCIHLGRHIRHPI